VFASPLARTSVRKTLAGRRMSDTDAVQAEALGVGD
jgi:hypothetical protein